MNLLKPRPLKQVRERIEIYSNSRSTKESQQCTCTKQCNQVYQSLAVAKGLHVTQTVMKEPNNKFLIFYAPN